MMNFKQLSSSSSNHSDLNVNKQEEEENNEISKDIKPILEVWSYTEKFLMLFKGDYVSNEDKLELFTQPVPEEIGNIRLIIVRKANKFSKIFSKYYLYNTYKSIFLLNAK